ncbi:MAG: hypothetical protein WDZ93_03250 [Candidatus Paceibacterota bacterium]
MEIQDTTSNPEHKAYLTEAWDMLPRHWQIAINAVVPAGAKIISPAQIVEASKAGDVIRFYQLLDHPLALHSQSGLEDLMALLQLTPSGQGVCCAWKFKAKFTSPEFYFQKHFLRALAVAAFQQHKPLREIVIQETRLSDLKESEMFFGDTFYKWLLYKDSDARVKERYGSALACLSCIDQQFEMVS